MEAAFWLAISRTAVLMLPFRWIAPHLGQLNPSPSETPIQPGIEQLSRQISSAVHRASRHMPGKHRCLVQAMAAKAMLKCRKIPTTLYLGVAKGDEAALCAHAWLRCGTRVVTGRGNLERYAVVAAFSDDKPLT